eukprot:g3632.t1
MMHNSYSQVASPVPQARSVLQCVSNSQGTGILSTPVRNDLMAAKKPCTPVSAAKPGHLVVVAAESAIQEMMVRGMEVQKKTRRGSWVSRVFYLGCDQHDVPKLIVEKAKSARFTGAEKGILAADVGSIERCGPTSVRILPHSDAKRGGARDFVLKLPTSRARDIVINRLSGLLSGMGVVLDSKAV